MSKKNIKIVLIAYYWPPAGGPGVQRWLKFTKYLREFDIDPVVYVPENPMYPIEDSSLALEIPEGITILKKPIFEPYRFAQMFSKKEAKIIQKGIISPEKSQSLIQRLLLFIRGNFFIPDARKFWVKPSVTYLKKYLTENQIDIIITTGPPHSIHLIGKELQKQLQLKWFADFRDPWTTIGYHSKLKLTKRSAKIHKNLEKVVLNAADQVLVTSYKTKKEFEAITSKPITVITNGYDTGVASDVDLDAKFTLSHIGSLLSGRNPSNLWKVLRELIKENDAFKNSFLLQLVGVVSEDVLVDIKEAGLTDYIELKGYVSHQDAIQLQRTSQVLLLIEIDSKETECIIPGKLFEYMASKRPILAFGPNDADVARLIKETKAGRYYGYHETENLKKHILDQFYKYQKNSLVSEASNIEKYSRRSLTNSLADVIKNHTT